MYNNKRNRSNLSNYLLSDPFHRNFENKDPLVFVITKTKTPPKKDP